MMLIALIVEVRCRAFRAALASASPASLPRHSSSPPTISADPADRVDSSRLGLERRARTFFLPAGRTTAGFTSYISSACHKRGPANRFATRHAITFAQLPTFRHLSPEQYQDRVAALIGEIEDEAETKRAGDSVAGVERILSQNPLEPPIRVTKRSPKPLVHVASKEARDDLIGGFLAFQTQHQIASASLRGGNLEAAGWFPEGCYPPALSFIGPPPPKRPPWPPTRQVRELDSGAIERGEIPLVEIGSPIAPKARGQPP